MRTIENIIDGAFRDLLQGKPINQGEILRVEQDVMLVLTHSSTEGNALRLPRQLDRKLYERTNKVLEAAGGKWNKRTKAHLYEGDAAEAMEQIILTGQVVSIKSELGAFYTPAALADEVIERACITPGMKVLEPSAGHGALVKPAMRASDGLVWAYEINPASAKIVSETLYPSGACIVEDFLQTAPAPAFDCVVMNPPFAKRADIHHVNHALRFLKTGGRLVAIMSASVTFRDDKLTSAFRELVEERGGSIEPNDEGAFKASGTMVDTVTVVIPNA